jgi:hypothetical protein
VNTASQNLTQHLDILREKLAHPTAYELALTYFLEEFAGDLGFHAQGQGDEARHLQVVLGIIAGKMVGRTEPVRQFGALYLPGYGFFHGQASVGGEPLLFFYFERANVGLAALIPLGGSEQQVARFQIPDLAARNPKHN